MASQNTGPFLSSQEISGHYNVICQRSQRYLCGSHVESFLLKKGNHLAPECTVSPGSVYQDDVCFRFHLFIFSSYLLIMSLLTGQFLSKKLLVAPRFCNHLRKHSLAQAGLKRSLCILQQLYHRLFMSAARSASLFFLILVNRKNRGRLYRFVNL